MRPGVRSMPLDQSRRRAWPLAALQAGLSPLDAARLAFSCWLAEQRTGLDGQGNNLQRLLPTTLARRPHAVPVPIRADR
jgi:hypothetical protein